jgi:hypothetical protein
MQFDSRNQDVSPKLNRPSYTPPHVAAGDSKALEARCYSEKGRTSSKGIS